MSQKNDTEWGGLGGWEGGAHRAQLPDLLLGSPRALEKMFRNGYPRIIALEPKYRKYPQTVRPTWGVWKEGDVAGLPLKGHKGAAEQRWSCSKSSS